MRSPPLLLYHHPVLPEAWQMNGHQMNAVSDAWSKSMMFKVCTAWKGNITWLTEDFQLSEVYHNNSVLKVIA